MIIIFLDLFCVTKKIMIGLWRLFGIDILIGIASERRRTRVNISKRNSTFNCHQDRKDRNERDCLDGDVASV
jgi:hypothetical protein